MAKVPGNKTLRALRPNAGIRAAYRRRLLALVDDMQRSWQYWIRAAYRKNPPLALDALPAADLARAIAELAKRWQDRFDDAAPELAAWFAQSVHTRSSRALADTLRSAGYSVKRFKMTVRLRDVMRASVEENVALIRSIPQDYHTQVHGLVMRSVQSGRDLESLSKALRARYAITRKRAELIARDQNNKATSAVLAVRQTDLGFKDGYWQHSHAGKTPRRTHLANDENKFSIVNGWYDPDPKVRRRIWPGELINCRCTWRPIIPGL